MIISPAFLAFAALLLWTATAAPVHTDQSGGPSSTTSHVDASSAHPGPILKGNAAAVAMNTGTIPAVQTSQKLWKDVKDNYPEKYGKLADEHIGSDARTIRAHEMLVNRHTGKSGGRRLARLAQKYAAISEAQAEKSAANARKILNPK